MAKASLLSQVRSIARQAAKSGSKWHILKGGEIACKDGRCTLGAIIFKRYEPARKIQEEFDALILKAEKLAKGKIEVSFVKGEQIFQDGLVNEDDKFPSHGTVNEVLNLDDALTTLVIDANDTSRASLERNVKNAKQEAKDFDIPLADYDDYQDAVRVLRAREILEEVLVGIKPKSKSA